MKGLHAAVLARGLRGVLDMIEAGFSGNASVPSDSASESSESEPKISRSSSCSFALMVDATIVGECTATGVVYGNERAPPHTARHCFVINMPNWESVVFDA